MSQLYVDNIKNRTGGSLGLPAGINVTGVSTFSSDVSIGGTLTYEDVTNIDSVGVITARSGIDVLTGGVTVVGGGITAVGVVTARSGIDVLTGGVTVVGGGITAIGVVTATSFVGDGTNLTNLPASGDSNDITACLFI